MRLGWVTAAAARGSDVDEPPALAALAGVGTAVDVVDWDDPGVDWAAYDRVVVRSVWDYHDRLDEFLRWAGAVAAVTDLRNPVAMLRWSTDKHYLAELGGRSALVQPLLASVAADGEWPLVFFDGRYSHAASKRVALPDGASASALYVPETTASYAASGAQVQVATDVVAAVTARFAAAPTYARVDLVRGDDGAPLVLEVELVEPSLFLVEGGAGAVDRLVAAVTA